MARLYGTLGQMVVITVIQVFLHLLLLTLSGFWGLWHLPRVWEHRHAALLDAFWMTVAFFFLFRSVIELGVASPTSELNPLLSSIVAPLTSGALCILVFPLLFFLNLNLVAAAGMVSSGEPSSLRGMLPLFWPLFLLCLVVDIALKDLGFWPSGFASVGTIFWALLLLRLLRRRALDVETLTQRLTSALHRKCTFGQGKRRCDVRGVVLGLIAGTIVLATPPPLFAPYRGAAYVSAIQFSNNLQLLTRLMDRSTEDRFPSLIRTSLDRTRMIRYGDLIILRYDASTRHQALSASSSEALIETQVLAKLAAASPKAIVLPFPPTPLSAIPRNPAHFTKLAQAARKARCAYFYNTPGHRPIPQLEKEAHGTGSAEVPPLPFLLRPLPKSVSGDLILIDYRTNLYSIHAPILLSEVLRDEPIYDTTTEKWVAPVVFFRGKTIFIEAMAPRSIMTPLGTQTDAEVLAQATATLEAGTPLVPLPLWQEVALVLGLSALVGQLCVGRVPLESVWRSSLPILLVVGFCLGMTAFGPYYVDPILPLLGALLSVLIVTQFTFAVERGERERNRSVLRRFLAPQVIEQMVDDPETKLGLGGKRGPIVVLFADVRGFSGFAERRTPEEVVATMNRYLAAMTDALNDHEGILDKYTGDGLMALFPVTDEAADVERAVHASIAMARAVQQVAQTLQAEGGDELAVGIGLHYGEAVVGLIGHPTRQVNYTALGHTVVVAARLQTLARGGEVILSKAVFEALPPGSLAVEAGESVSVKGVGEPVPIYRLKVGNPSNRG